MLVIYIEMDDFDLETYTLHFCKLIIFQVNDVSISKRNRFIHFLISCLQRCVLLFQFKYCCAFSVA